MSDDGGDAGGDMSDSGAQEPWMYRLPTISHYYGDTVRQIFLATAAIMLLGAPFYGDDLRLELPFEIIGAVILVCVAALTNPWKKSVVLIDSIISGVGLVIFELWALTGYGAISPIAFVIRQALAIAFMFAFYFSMKTLRAMTMHQVGKPDTKYEFHRIQHEVESPAEQKREEGIEKKRVERENFEETMHGYQD